MVILSSLFYCKKESPWRNNLSIFSLLPQKRFWLATSTASKDQMAQANLTLSCAGSKVKVTKEGEIVISQGFSYWFDSDLLFCGILITKSKQMSLFQDYAQEWATRTQKEANGRGKKVIAVRNLLWVFLSNHSGGTLTFACSFGMGQPSCTLSITVRVWAYSLSMFETEQDRGVQWVMLMCQGKLHEGSMQLNVRGHLSHLMKTIGISTVNLFPPYPTLY